MAFPIDEIEDDLDPNDDGSDLRRDLVRLCGETAADRFLSTFSGCRIRIPYRPAAKSRLVDAIGFEAAVSFAAEYGGEVMNVPAGEMSAWRRRTQRIREMIMAGTPCYDIARETGCTERAVRKARAKLRAKGVLA